MKVYSINYKFTRAEGIHPMAGRSLNVGIGLENIIEAAEKQIKEKYSDYDNNSFKLVDYLDLPMSELYDKIQACAEIEEEEDEYVKELIDELPNFDNLIKEQ